MAKCFRESTIEMKVSKAQAQANRMRIIETASVLFRERGYDGVSVADLMAAAGFTHGGFYKHFDSKADLMSEAVAGGLAQSVSASADKSVAEFIEDYLSHPHRNAMGKGCTMAALGADVARQPVAAQQAFAGGLEAQLATIKLEDEHDAEAARAAKINLMAHAVGALVLSRACPDDSELADEILQVCRKEILRRYGEESAR